MHEVVGRTGRAERLRFVGAQRPVLWERSGQSAGGWHGLLWTGWTDNYLRVRRSCPTLSILAESDNAEYGELEAS